MEDDEEEQHPMSLEEVNAACLQEDLTLIMSTLGVTHDSFSIYKNVYQIEIDPHQGKYMALGTNENGVNICLGIFEMEHEAALAYARHIARKDKEDDEDDEDNEEEEEADRARKKTDEADRMAACSTTRPAKGASRYPDAKGAAQKGVAKGAAAPGKEVAGSVSVKAVYEIAASKEKHDAMCTGLPLESIARSVAATAKTMGLKLVR
jgi:hypothetical protein